MWEWYVVGHLTTDIVITYIIIFAIIFAILPTFAIHLIVSVMLVIWGVIFAMTLVLFVFYLHDLLLLVGSYAVLFIANIFILNDNPPANDNGRGPDFAVVEAALNVLEDVVIQRCIVRGVMAGI